jgi:hypothetical protein
MNANRIVPITVALAVVGVTTVIAFWPTCPGQKITTTAGNPDQASEDYVKATQARIVKLKQRIAEEKAADAVTRYAPAAPGQSPRMAGDGRFFACPLPRDRFQSP